MYLHYFQNTVHCFYSPANNLITSSPMYVPRPTTIKSRENQSNRLAIRSTTICRKVIINWLFIYNHLAIWTVARTDNANTMMVHSFSFAQFNSFFFPTDTFTRSPNPKSSLPVEPNKWSPAIASSLIIIIIIENSFLRHV